VFLTPCGEFGEFFSARHGAECGQENNQRQFCPYAALWGLGRDE
jgi:hypothetical protein